MRDCKWNKTRAAEKAEDSPKTLAGETTWGGVGGVTGKERQRERMAVWSETAPRVQTR